MNAQSDTSDTITTALRVGLVVDSVQVLKFVADIATWCIDTPELELAVVIVKGADPTPPKSMIDAWKMSSRKFVMAKLRAIEAMSLRHHPRIGEHATTVDLSMLGAPILSVQPALAEGGHGLIFSAYDRAAIDAFRPDVLVCCGHGEPADEILAALRLGALAVRFGEPTSKCTLAVGFDEVMRRAGETRFSIVQRRHDAVGGETLLRGDVSTQGRWLANKAFVCSSAAQQLMRLLIRLAREGAVPALENRGPSDRPQPQLPSISRQVRYAVETVARIARDRMLTRVFRADWQWSIGYVWRNWRDVELSGAVDVPNPPGHYYADPFVASVGGETVVFVEDYDMGLGRGVITALRLDSAGAARLGVVLDEPFHLSFPYLFEHDGALFMIPESSEAGQVRLYRCHGFPLDWRLETVLMDGVVAVDSMVFASEGRWWMLTCLDADSHGALGNELHLFSADRPDSSSWAPHRANPILISADGGRNGGLLRDGPNFYRVGQTHGFLRYGMALSINKILRIDDCGYAEQRIATVRSCFRPGIDGTHHMHSNGQVTVFDYCRLRQRAR